MMVSPSKAQFRASRRPGWSAFEPFEFAHESRGVVDVVESINERFGV